MRYTNRHFTYLLTYFRPRGGGHGSHAETAPCGCPLVMKHDQVDLTVEGVSRFWSWQVDRLGSLYPLIGTGNYSATSNNMKLVHWPLMAGLLHLVQRWGDGAGPQPAQAPPRCTKCNSPPISGQCTIIVMSVALRFNMPVKGLMFGRSVYAWRHRNMSSELSSVT